AALMALVVYFLALRLSDRLAATVVATAFLYLCAFGHYYFNGIFNWVMPYTYSATYGMLAAAASLLLLVRHVQDGRRGDLWLSVACLVLAALCKVEAVVPAAVTHALFLATTRPRLAPYLAGAAVVLGVFAVFRIRVGSRFVDDYLSFA